MPARPTAMSDDAHVSPLRRLGNDLADGWNVMRGGSIAHVPLEERTWLRRHAADLYHSDRGRRVRGDALDLLDTLRGRRDPLLPPRRLNFVGRGGNFVAVGDKFKRQIVELGGLEPHHDVLDVGSGIGRMARPLTGWLTGRYEGFDIVREGVEWCQREITPRHPNFHFQLADIHNNEYNPAGRHAPEEYGFPYEDGSFDFAFLNSVFTHLLPPAVDNYLSELHRVLRPGATLFATYFLMNEEAQQLLGGTGGFGYDASDHLLAREERPELAVAFPEAGARELHDRLGVPIQRVHYGSWCGRDDRPSYQDITISARR